MKYRYGDATPFPLQENFIETIVGATDLCVALFRADAAADERRSRAQAAREEADAELAQLDALSGAVAEAVSLLVPEEGKPKTPTQMAAAKIAQTARSAAKASRARVIKRRDKLVRAALRDVMPQRVQDAIADFFVNHQLPRTEWRVHWQAGSKAEPARAEVLGTTPSGLTLVFDCAVPEASPWSSAVKVGDLEPAVTVEFARPQGLWKKRVAVGPQRLDRYVVTEVFCSHDEQMMQLRAPGRDGGGMEVVVRGGDYPAPMIFRLDERGNRTDEPLLATGDNELEVSRLWRQIQAQVGALISRRDALLSAELRDTALTELDNPSELGELILEALAPIVREMRIRSRVPGELVLKRDLGDGRREELYVPRADLLRKYSDLPREYVMLFEAMGLGDDLTSEFVTREFSTPPRRRPRVTREIGPSSASGELNAADAAAGSGSIPAASSGSIPASSSGAAPAHDVHKARTVRRSAPHLVA